MNCCGGMKDHSMSTKTITVFLESRQYSSNVTLAIATTYKIFFPKKNLKTFVWIYFMTQKNTSRTKTCNNSRYNIFLLCFFFKNALRISLTSLLKGGYHPKPSIAFYTNLSKETSQKINMLTLCQTHHFKLCVSICDAKPISVKFHKVKKVEQFWHVIQDNTHKPNTWKAKMWHGWL
jgi:hypothetical protein